MILNQVWTQIVYEPFADDLTYGLVYEISHCHHLEKMDELMIKRDKLKKATKMLTNIQNRKDDFPYLVISIMMLCGS